MLLRQLFEAKAIFDVGDKVAFSDSAIERLIGTVTHVFQKGDKVPDGLHAYAAYDKMGGLVKIGKQQEAVDYAPSYIIDAIPSNGHHIRFRGVVPVFVTMYRQDQRVADLDMYAVKHWIERNLEVPSLDKDDVVKGILKLYRNDDNDDDYHSLHKWIEYLIAVLRLAGYDYPEFKAVEKSMRINESAAGSWVPFFKNFDKLEVMGFDEPIDPEEMEQMSHVEKMQLQRSGDTLWMYVAAYELGASKVSNLVYAHSDGNDPLTLDICNTAFKRDTQSPDYGKLTDTGLFQYGRIFGVAAVKVADHSGYYCYMINGRNGNANANVHGDDYVKAALDINSLDKDTVVKALLTMYKQHHASSAYVRHIQAIISLLRKSGQNYPEFEVLEKSIGEK